MLCGICGKDLAAQTVESELVNQFEKYTDNNFTEKVFVHTDRNFYIAGEIIWFKAYLVNNPDNHFSRESRVLYVEMLDEANRAVLQAKIGIDQGKGEGSFFLSTEFPSGNYKLRAYTNWMKNFDAAYFFEKDITIVNASVPLSPHIADTVAMYDMHFFPEGGKLVKGIPSVVAFRLTDKNGRGVDGFQGVVVDSNNDTITSFLPFKFGIGRFSFNPSTAGKYTAYITTASGQHFSKDLPLPDNAGYLMQVNSTEHRVRITVKTNIETPYVYAIAHNKGRIGGANRLELINGRAEIEFDKNKLGTGISHITVFDASRRAVCERLYFATMPPKPGIETKVAQQYEKRAKVVVKLNTADTANLSLAIYREDGLQDDDPFDIFSYLWLNSDLKGTVDSAGWYFKAPADSAKMALDNLMLTHGWRRFDWRNIRQNTIPDFEFLPEINGHIVTGKITDSATGKPIPKAIAFLSFPGTHGKFYTSEANKNGGLLFYTKDVYGRGELVTEADNTFGTPYNIEILSPYAGSFSSRAIAPFHLPPSLATALQKNSINAQVVRKFGGDRLKELGYPAVADTTRFYGKSDETYLLDNYTRFTTMEEVLREYVLGVLVGGSAKNYRLRVIDALSNSIMRDNPLVLLDGVPVLKMNSIIGYDPLKVRRLDVLKGKYFYGAAVFSGIVDFTTYKGNMENYEMNPEAIVFDYDGLQLRREFYSPLYDTPERQQSKLADYRNLLYWNPDITTNKGGTEVSFYTSDLSGNYKGVLQGLSADGKACVGSFAFTVQ